MNVDERGAPLVGIQARWLRPLALSPFLIAFLIGSARGQAVVPNTFWVHETSGVAQSNRPVSIARPFRQGEIREFARASVDGVSVLTQCDVKNRWPDGSLKFAVVSFVIPNLPGGGSVTITLSNQATGNNTGYLTGPEMLGPSYDFDGQIEMAGARVERVNARSLLTAGSFRYWLQGPVVTAVIIEDRTPARSFDRDFGDGSKALHPIFEAWFYPQTGKVDLGYTIENTWASTDPTRSMRDLSYSLTLRSGLASPVTEFTHPTFSHIGRTRWHKRYWIGTDPRPVRVDHNPSYLVSTRVIPNYDTSRPLAASLVADKYSAWTGSDKTLDGDANGIGNYKKAINQSGSNMWIGLMNTWDTIYLLTMDDRMLEMSLGNADLAGRIPAHLREADSQAGTGRFFDKAGTVETFGRTVSVNARKQVTLVDLAEDCGGTIGTDKINTGTISPDGWATIKRDHMPEVAYVAYLITGRYYYLEELQYWASYVVGHKQGCMGGTYARQGSAGYLNDSEVRGDAWGFRTLVLGAFLSPDGSPEKLYYEDKMANNIAEWEGEHDLPITDPARQTHWNWGNVNRKDSRGVSPLGSWRNMGAGFIGPPLDVSVSQGASPWEENFFTSACGMAKQFGYPMNTLMRFLARRNFNILLNPATVPYLVEAYRYPTILVVTNNWVQTWGDFGNHYLTLPTAWQTGTDVDHGYGYIALGTMSFLYDQAVDGYTGQQAWNFIKANKPEQNRFLTESPKWNILPYAVVSADQTPPSAVRDLSSP
jgi:hypothetical protein